LSGLVLSGLVLPGLVWSGLVLPGAAQRSESLTHLALGTVMRGLVVAHTGKLGWEVLDVNPSSWVIVRILVADPVTQWCGSGVVRVS